MAEATLSATGLQRENIVYDKDGNAYIPASQRPDGSWRKARRVKDGYIPQDEIPAYQSKGKLIAQQEPRIPGGIFLKESPSPPRQEFYDASFDSPDDKLMTRAQKKNAKKKQKKKEKKGSEVAFEIEEVIEGLEEVSFTAGLKSTPQTTPDQTPSTSASAPDKEQCSLRLSGSAAEQSVTETGRNSSPTTEQQSKELLKRVRAIRKKLKQIEELESRIASGDITKPDQDQLNKLAKKEEFLEELRELQQC